MSKKANNNAKMRYSVEVQTITETAKNSREILVTENGITTFFGVTKETITHTQGKKLLFTLNFEEASVTLSEAQFVAFFNLVSKIIA